MLGGADNPNGELPSYITGANNVNRTAIVTVGGKTILRFPASCDSRAIVVRYRHTFPVKYTAWSQKKAVARSVAVSWIIWGKSALNSWNW